MSGSETGLMAASRESMPFTMGLHHQHNQTPPPQQQQEQSKNMQLSFGTADGTAVYKPMSAESSPPPQYQHNSPGGGGGAGNPSLNINMPVTMTESEPVKKRRGRPRKYGPESGGVSLGMVPGAPFTVSQPSGGGDQRSGGDDRSGGDKTSPTQKKTRGRPLGSKNSCKRLKLQPLGSTGVGFIPHVLNVRTGEDVSSRIMAFSQNGPRTVCVLSANGTISNVTLRQSATSGGTVTYEGRFELLSLTGSFLLLENNGHRSRTGGLSVSLSAPDGHVLGGCVAGLLIAASPVQIVVGSFIPDGQKDPRQLVGLSPILPRVVPSHVLMAQTPSSPQSRGTMSESSCGGHGSPLHQSTGGPPYNNANLSLPWK